jgi:hypothetical protein
MLSAYPAPSECYLYGPVCVAESERGLGIALALFELLNTHTGAKLGKVELNGGNGEEQILALIRIFPKHL